MGKKSKRNTARAGLRAADHVLTPEAASSPSPPPQPRKGRPTVAQNAQELHSLATTMNGMQEHLQTLTSMLEEVSSRLPAATGCAGNQGRHNTLLDDTRAETGYLGSGLQLQGQSRHQPDNDRGQLPAHRGHQVGVARLQPSPPDRQSRSPPRGRSNQVYDFNHHRSSDSSARGDGSPYLSQERQRFFTSPCTQARHIDGDATGAHSPERGMVRDGARGLHGQRPSADRQHAPTVRSGADCRAQSVPHRGPPAPPVMPQAHGVPFHCLPDTDTLHQPQTIKDLEADAAIQQRVAKALQSALLPEPRSKLTHPHHFIFRGQKRDNTGLAELTVSEYLAGFLEMMELRAPESAEKAYMYHHFSRVLNNARTYEWPSVRHWSEEVCTRISEGKLTWRSTYEIDRMELQMAHDRRTVHASEGRSASATGNTYDIDPNVLKARPGPPCRAYQTGECTHQGDHVTNRQRSLHVCAYCVYYKCSLFPHPEKECRAKYNSHAESGFGE